MAVDVDAPSGQSPKRLPLPWWLVAGAGPVAVLAVGWVLVAAFCAVGWLTSPEADLGAALRLATSVLLLAHGGTVLVGGQAVSLAPLGLTALLVFVAIPVSSLAARLAASHGQDPDDTGELLVDGEAVALRVACLFAGVYFVVVLLTGALLGNVTPGLVIGTIVVAAVSGLWGASRGVGYDPTAVWPSWLQAVPRAMGAALLVVFAGAAAALALALWSGQERVTDIVVALGGGAVGAVLQVVLHLLYLPNLVLACASWVLGAGITFGDGTLVTVATTDVGILPSIPVLGAVPTGDMSPVQLWWLVVGVLAGLVAGVVIALARPRARFDETALVGGLSGVLAGLLVAAACALGSGGLGTGRLAEVGARFPELLIFAPTILGLSGLTGGLAVGLLRREWPERRRTGDDGRSPDPVDDAAGDMA